MSAVTQLPPTSWTTGTTEVFRTGTWRSARPWHVRAPSPCRQACPVSGDIAGWVGHAAAGDLRAAWDVLVRRNPFPAVAGRVCHHPCESACNRGAHDGAVAVCRLERHVGDAAIAAGWRFEPPRTERDGRVAVVGGGPAGLSASYRLRRLGWQVTLLESSDALGGLMRSGIPSYRLSRAVLDAEIARIVALGVDVRLRAPLGSPQDLRALRDAHDAVLVATGAARPHRLPALDYSQPWALDGATWLAGVNAGRPAPIGERVVVVGGGSAAIDAARSARREGRRVVLLALEPRDAMPAQREEVEEALDEGVELVDAAMLDAAVHEDGALRLDCRRVRLVGAAAGGPILEAIPGSGFALRADAVIASIGQSPDLRALDGLPARGGRLAVDARQSTGAERVWAAGDVTGAAGFVTEAIGAGRRAARAIHLALGGTDDDADDADDDLARTSPAVPLSAIATWHHRPASRTPLPSRPAGERVADHDESQLGFDAAAALAESARCFSCGTCVECDHCVVFCPDLAIRRTATGYEVLDDWCKGCGLCVRECPSGAMTLRKERR
jgi:NADPH-dependent glutamate synthase beta subunit-like oxidoreductase